VLSISAHNSELEIVWKHSALWASCWYINCISTRENVLYLLNITWPWFYPVVSYRVEWLWIENSRP
jgi:hypothetical protein